MFGNHIKIISLLLLLVCLITAEFPSKLVLTEDYYESRGSAYSDDLDEAGKFLKKFDSKADDLVYKNGLVNWAYETDLTDKHLEETVNEGLEVSEFFLQSSENASQIKTLDLPGKIHRQISLIRRSAEPTSYPMRREIRETIGKLTSIFGKGKVRKKSKNYTLSDLTELMKKSKSRKELNWAWKSWRDKVGPPMKVLYSNLVDLLNVGSREHGWIDYGDFLRSDYEMGDDFELSLDRVWKEVEPLYKELHAYVRYHLSKQYKTGKNGCIPANLLGDMFAQNWENIFNTVKPSKSSKAFDVSDELKKQNYTVNGIFRLAEQFFVSLGLEKMPASFWKNSVLEKPKSKDMVCHASAWDVSNTDVRIKMCTKINQEDLTTVHHEMGHIEYFLAYKNQPNMFRAGANPGFHEAIGDTISLSVETTNYLHQVKLTDSPTLGKDDTISFLLNQALRRLAPIPYNLLVDKWRWRVYEGNITENSYNKEWWKMRVKYQGVEPPVTRPANAFDPASKYHIGANVPYIAYFVSYILQFQLHKAFCKEAGFNGPLHDCSIYKSKEAGKKLKEMLEAGRSKPWPKILKEAIGENELKATAILEYFSPLRDWLKQQRENKKYPIGWKEQMSTQVLQKKTKKYEAGQERSGILKTNSGDVSLSINIPSVTLNELLKKTTSSDQTQEPTNIKNNTNIPSQAKKKNVTETPTIDLEKLLNSAKTLSIKSSETTASQSEEGKAKITNKEIDINSDGAKQKSKSGSTHSKADPAMGAASIGATLQKAIDGIANKSTGITSHEESSLAPSNEDSKTLPVLSLPLAVNDQPKADFPSTVVTEKEPKENPSVAGVAKNPVNPVTAAVQQEPKSNPVPSNQIALVPVSLPANLISALKTALNGTTDVDLSKIQSAATNTSKVENEASQPTELKGSDKTGNGKQFANLLLNIENSSALMPPQETAQSLTNKTTTEEEITPALSNATITKNGKQSIYPIIITPQADSQLLDLKNTTETKVTSMDNSSAVPNHEVDSFRTTQDVTPCKREDGSPCMQSKIVTEGNSFPVQKTGVDKSKQTVSVSPSLLIEKLLEHHVAENSAPEPVVNAVPTDLKKNTSSARSEPFKTGDEKTSNEFDFNNLMKALTASSAVGNTTSLQNQTNQTTMTRNADEKNSLEFLSSLSQQNNNANINNSTKTERNVATPSCSDLKRRHISLSFNCEEKPSNSNHKGGSLSISPSELIQRLLDSKSKNEVSRKTIPSARVVKTPNGFQLNFDLNTKDKIPSEIGDTKSVPIGRQQHVNVFNTPKGMVVKPKSSLQLLTPLFVPIQNKDNIELGNKEG